VCGAAAFTDGTFDLEPSHTPEQPMIARIKGLIRDPARPESSLLRVIPTAPATIRAPAQ
jgi:hypothetical protein